MFSIKSWQLEISWNNNSSSRWPGWPGIIVTYFADKLTILAFYGTFVDQMLLCKIAVQTPREEMIGWRRRARLTDYTTLFSKFLCHMPRFIIKIQFYPTVNLGVSLVPLIDFGGFYVGYSSNIYFAHMACLWIQKPIATLKYSNVVSSTNTKFHLSDFQLGRQFCYCENGRQLYNIFSCNIIGDANGSVWCTSTKRFLW